METTLSEYEIAKLEDEFPHLAAKAFREARERALAAGLSVVETHVKRLYKVNSDVSRDLIMII